MVYSRSQYQQLRLIEKEITKIVCSSAGIKRIDKASSYDRKIKRLMGEVRLLCNIKGVEYANTLGL